MEPVQAIFLIVGLIRAKKYSEAIPAALRLAAYLWETYYPTEHDGFSSIAGFQALSTGKSCDQLCDDLEAFAKPSEGLSAPVGDAKDWLPVVLPILFELIRKLVEELFKPKDPA